MRFFLKEQELVLLKNSGGAVAARRALAAAVLLLLHPCLQAQTKQMLQWSAELDYLSSAPAGELPAHRAAIVQIRKGVELWLKMRPDTQVELRPAPPEPWDAEQLRDQVAALTKAMAGILEADPNRPFEMGVTMVTVTAEASPLSPVAASVDPSEIINRQAFSVAAALDYVPGVAVDHVSAGRNEAAVRLRGFTSRGQVPFYIDGIQVSMPYDGTIDFNRFLSSDVAEIQVSKGYASPLLGPNGMGGAINLVTRQPQEKLQADVMMGTGSAGTLLSSVNLGSRWSRFYVQGTFDWQQTDFVPLSGKFTLNAFQPTYKRLNSDSRDAKYTGRFGWTPKSAHQYVFSWINQKAEKGVPLYAGPNSAAIFNAYAYRRWPYWNKTAYYLITGTPVGESASIKFRAYYDQFNNQMAFYDSATFSSMNKSTSNHSYYDDHSAGGSTEFTTRAWPRNLASASFHFRDDNHKETLEYPARSPYPYFTPTLLNRAQTLSMGFQDLITVSSRTRASVGFSTDHMKGLRIQKLNVAETALVPVTCAADPGNTSFSGCTAHVWSYNPQASVSYDLTTLGSLFLTVADRSRFPLLKESYSYKLGTGIPNPDLKPEHNTSINAGYSHVLPARTLVQVEYFYNRLRDAIQSAYVKDPGSLCPSSTGTQTGYCSQNVNIARQTHQGVEVSVRTSPVPRLTLDANYSYLNRKMLYEFGGNIDVSQVLTAVQILPTYPKNKVISNATFRLPHDVLALASYRYEGGIVLQDTTYRTAPGNLAFSTSYSTADLGVVVPIAAGFSIQAGVRNLFDRNYYYTAGYPESGRNWFFSTRYRF
ncbi:MAG: TonB-dependent receptor plug domain-containing protein [Bryobacteraceae bacterium]